jgi:hypothetical protein
MLSITSPDLTWPGLEPTIYKTEGEHAIHYITNAVKNVAIIFAQSHGHYLRNKYSIQRRSYPFHLKKLGKGDNLQIFLIKHFWLVRFMVLNATFNNISVMSWLSVLLVEETGVPGENHRPVASHWQTLSQNVVHLTAPWSRFELTTSVVIGTDYIGSCKSNYHTITATTAPSLKHFCKLNKW